jgi:glycine/D-amino acid oxidase-like deaminating enzyme
MSASVVLGRMAGDGVTVFAAWFHQALMLGTGVGIIVAAWVSGLN